jgi:hypothetical protein
MGVQLLQAFVGIGRLGEDERPVVVVNSGGDIPGAKTSQLHWVTDPQCEVREDHEGMRKTPYWHGGAAATAFRGRENTLRWLPLLEHAENKPNNLIIVHMRGGDKPVATIEAYKRFVAHVREQHPNGSIALMSDDVVMLDEIEPDRVQHLAGEPDEDWFTILNAKHVYCATSSFVTSTLLYNPQKKVTVMPRAWCDGTYGAIDDDYRFLEDAQMFCPNLEIMS